MRLRRERIHSDNVSSARFAATLHNFISRGRARMLRLTERDAAMEIVSILTLYICQYIF
jgi:hypothetical protein